MTLPPIPIIPIHQYAAAHWLKVADLQLGEKINDCKSQWLRNHCKFNENWRIFLNKKFKLKKFFKSQHYETGANFQRTIGLFSQQCFKKVPKYQANFQTRLREFSHPCYILYYHVALKSSMIVLPFARTSIIYRNCILNFFFFWAWVSVVWDLVV